MKKYVLLLVMGGFCMAASAQSNSRFSLGPNAGVGSTWIDNFDNKMGKTHGNVGLSLIFSAVEHFGVGLDAKYSFEGGKRQYNTNIAGTTFNTTEELNLNYVRLPLKAIFFFNNHGNRLRPKIAVGPNFGFLVSARQKVKTTGPGGNIVSETDAEFDDHFGDFDFGLHGSAGINYRLVQRTWLQADIVYNHGISDIREHSTSGPKLHNRNIGINIGVNFGL